MAKKRAPRRDKRDLVRASLACGVLAAILALAVFVGTGGLQPMQPPPEPSVKSGESLASASMVFVPAVGDRCRKRVIDNTTWRVRDDGEVDCNTALGAGAGSANTRVDIIRKGFRKE
jgi:hypothetical protein